MIRCAPWTQRGAMVLAQSQGTIVHNPAADQLIGRAEAIRNIPSDIVNAPNRLAHFLISPFTDFRFPDLVPSTFQPANTNQALGMEARPVTLVATPIGCLASGSNVVEVIQPRGRAAIRLYNSAITPTAVSAACRSGVSLLSL